MATLNSSSRVNSPGSMSSPESVTSRSRSEASIRRSTRAPEKLSTSIASRRAYWVGPDSPLAGCSATVVAVGSSSFAVTRHESVARQSSTCSRTGSRQGSMTDSRVGGVRLRTPRGRRHRILAANTPMSRSRESPQTWTIYAGFAHDLLKSNELNHQAVSVLGAGQLARRYGNGRLELRLDAVLGMELTLASLASNRGSLRTRSDQDPDLHCDVQCERRSLEDGHVFSVGRHNAVAVRQATRCTALRPSAHLRRRASVAGRHPTRTTPRWFENSTRFPAHRRYASRPLPAPSSSAPSNNKSSELWRC